MFEFSNSDPLRKIQNTCSNNMQNPLTDGVY